MQHVVQYSCYFRHEYYFVSPWILMTVNIQTRSMQVSLIKMETFNLRNLTWALLSQAISSSFSWENQTD